MNDTSGLGHKSTQRTHKHIEKRERERNNAREKKHIQTDINRSYVNECECVCGCVNVSFVVAGGMESKKKTKKYE